MAFERQRSVIGLRSVGLCAALFHWLIAGGAVAQMDGSSERRITLPDHGDFVIRIPREWKDQVRRPSGQLPPTITLGPESGKPFQILITPIWSATRDRPLPSREQIRAAVERGAAGASAQSAEKALRVVEFHGRTGPGFYFSATDRAPKPGEYKYLTQGILRVGALTVTFTILTNERQEQVVTQALDALKGAAQEGV